MPRTGAAGGNGGLPQNGALPGTTAGGAAGGALPGQEPAKSKPRFISFPLNDPDISEKMSVNSGCLDYLTDYYTCSRLELIGYPR